MSIPVYHMEEHHEAFYYWHQMIHDGAIPATNNFLLHIDHHDDFEGGGYAWNLNQLPTDMEDVAKFTYGCLGIADFIQPAIYQKIFNEIHIFKNLMPQPVISEKNYIKCLKDCELANGKYIPFLHADLAKKNAPGYSFYTYHTGGLAKVDDYKEIIKNKTIVLDMDLDYFSWDDSLSTRKPKRIELTKQGYEDYMNNPYHPFRIMPKHWVYGVEDNGKYYLEYHESIPKAEPASQEDIQRRVDKLVDWLVKCEVKPVAIDICTSRFSGYLPTDSYPFVEETFLKKIKEVWDIELVNK